jgi:hypothetical protein
MNKVSEVCVEREREGEKLNQMAVAQFMYIKIWGSLPTF